MADYRAQPQGTWVLETCQNARFPYRLQVFRSDKLWFTLRVQDRWPAANRNIFCLREVEPPDTDDPLDEGRACADFRHSRARAARLADPRSASLQAL